MASSTTHHVISPRAARNTRGQIVDVALEQFTEQGYEGTSLQQIADQLGLTKAALYYHFKSKDDLLLAVLDPYLADIDALLEQQKDPDRPVPESREEPIEGYLDFLLEHRQLLSYLSRDAAALARPAVAARMQAYQAAISTGIAGANLTPEDQIKVSFALGGMQGAISAHASIPADDLRAPILEGVYAVLNTLSSDRAHPN
jgi:AcrR family transcriptional regulator